MWPWPRIEWAHLGHVVLKYVDKDEIPISIHVVHFYADKENFGKRKVEVLDQFITEHHPWYQENVVPWLQGGNLYRPIEQPSDWLEAYTQKQSGYKRIGGKWVKPAPIASREDNVITLKKG